MSATPRNNEGVNESSGTLGDLLYVDETKSRVSEQEWLSLVNRIASGEQAALKDLYERTYRLVFTLIMRLVGNRASAEEVTLDVFHEVWLRASTYDERGGSVIGWIMNRARSRAIDRLRYDQRKKRVAPDGAAPDPQVPDNESSVDDGFERSLRAALTTLGNEERRAIELAYFSDLTYAEVAGYLNEPLGTIKTRIRSGLMKLRRAMAAGVSAR